MTREEAKAWFKVLLKDEYAFNSADREAFAMAIKALEQEPCDVFDEYGNYNYPSDVELTEPNTATSMPCEDAISREATLKPYNGLNDEDTISVWLIRKNIEQQPPVNPQPKTGKWIDSPNGYFTHCSECGLHGDKGIYKHYGWCPKCGARMIELQESENK